MDATEFDATLGGNEHLPYSANSLKFAASRSVEIAAMTEAILRPSKNNLIFQSLPVFMRRRVMSHNSKRLPRKLRERHLEQLKKSGLSSKQKRPSRKYRRRPKNLLEEYNRRQKKQKWLETHIWHAKRFHMTERWGYRLPYAPCDKAFRACYRGSSAHCLLQDISYYVPIQVIGTIDYIKEMFSKITNTKSGLGICARAYTNGNRQGILNIYGIDTYPFGYIGKAQFIWIPSESTSKTLWLFVHPSQAKDIESVLSLMCTNNMNTEYETIKKKRKLDSCVQFKVMPDCFNRFRLTGPNSHAILSNSLECLSNSDKLNRNDKWMKLHEPKYLEEKMEYWNSIMNISSTSLLPPQIIIGLTVKDPRIQRPLKRTKAEQITDNIEIDSETLLKIPPYISQSPLWNTAIHEAIKVGKMSTSQFIQHVMETQLVPGEVNKNDPALQSVPVVLVQRPGSQESEYKKLGYGSGWDIIMPSGYALQFWLTFIMFGARSGGLRETESMAFEMGECFLPPDSNSGTANEKMIETQLKDRYFRLPPSKRVNYNKLAINSPFRCPWNVLLRDWCDQCRQVDDFFVLRDRKLLDEIQDCIVTKKSLPDMENKRFCLIPVYTKLIDKGNLQKHAIICMPENQDLGSIKYLFESKHEDPNEKERKLKRFEHVRLLKRLKRKKKKLKLKQNKAPVILKKPKSARQFPSDYVKAMRELWLPSRIETVRYTSSRQVMGFISQGAFSFTEARSCGIGYVVYNALNSLLNSNKNQILLRNTSSRKYRLGNITVLKDL